eukprot:scaffold13505_cov81-Skeletonema_dohrnii-CCMP3373.AAC.3
MQEQHQHQIQQQQTFPFKLYNMLEYACDSEFSSSVSWTADGSAFIIHDQEVMMDNLAPMFFNQTKFRSFTRQLNIWGFVRTVTLDGWRHNNFLRGRPHLLNEIERTQVKSSEKKSFSIAKAEALAQQARTAVDSAKSLAVAANETSSRVDAQAQSFQSSNADNSAHVGIAAAASAAVSQFPFAQAPAQGQGSVFSYLFQDATSLLPPSVQRYSSDETTINQVARTEQAGAIDRYRYDAYTTSASTSTSGAAVQPFGDNNVAAHPFDHDELMYLASIFEQDEHKSQEDD